MDVVYVTNASTTSGTTQRSVRPHPIFFCVTLPKYSLPHPVFFLAHPSTTHHARHVSPHPALSQPHLAAISLSPSSLILPHFPLLGSTTSHLVLLRPFFTLPYLVKFYLVPSHPVLPSCSLLHPSSFCPGSPFLHLKYPSSLPA